MRRGVAVAIVAATGCGRDGLDSLGDAGTVGDGGTPISLAPGGFGREGRRSRFSEATPRSEAAFSVRRCP